MRKEWRVTPACFFSEQNLQMTTAFETDAAAYVKAARMRLARAVASHERRMAGVHSHKTILATAELKSNAYGCMETLQRRLNGGETLKDYDAVVDACLEVDEAVRRFKRRCKFMYEATTQTPVRS